MTDSKRNEATGSKPGRPFIIWLTQIFVLLFALVALWAVVQACLYIPAMRAAQFPWWRLAAAILWPGALLGVFASLFIGLVRRQRWSWSASVAFAVFLLVLLAYSKTRQLSGPIPLLPIEPDQRFGAMIGEALVFGLAILYPLRMYLSAKARAFLGIRPRGA